MILSKIVCLHTIYFFLYFMDMTVKDDLGVKIETREIKKPSPGGEGLLESGDEWIRTTDSRIFSPMLYQLSYITALVAQNYTFLLLEQKFFNIKGIKINYCF